MGGLFIQGQVQEELPERDLRETCPSEKVLSGRNLILYFFPFALLGSIKRKKVEGGGVSV